MTWTVGDVMSKDVVSVGRAASFKTCADLMRVHGVSALPVVVDGDRLAGIVSEADLMGRAAFVTQVPGDPVEAATDLAPLSAGDLMATDVATIRAKATIAVAARTMVDRRVKLLPVVDSSNRVVGIVSRSDVLKVFMRSDESIRKDVAYGLLNELPLLGRGRVQVEVRDGVVRLTGGVESGSLKGLLLRLVAAVPGVVGVENRLELAPAPGELELAGPRGRSSAHG